jgi:hypothetical protein
MVDYCEALRAFRIFSMRDVASELGNVDRVKRTYHKLALRYHPDKPTGDTARFQKLQDCYEKVCAFLEMSPTRQECIFFIEGARKLNPPPPPPPAIDARVDVTLEELFRGATKEVVVDKRAARGGAAARRVCVRVHIARGQQIDERVPVKVADNVHIAFRLVLHERFALTSTLADIGELTVREPIVVHAHEIVNGRYRYRFTHLNGRQYQFDLAMHKAQKTRTHRLKSMGMPCARRATAVRCARTAAARPRCDTASWW